MLTHYWTVSASWLIQIYVAALLLITVPGGPKK